MTRRRVARFALSLAVGGAVAWALVRDSVPAPAAPVLPRVEVDTASAPPEGRTIMVAAGGSLQTALGAAQPGDVIALEAGATFPGPFTLPRKPGSGWITIRTAAPDRNLPPPGVRVDPSHAGVMPKLVASSGSVIRTEPGAHHYRFIGIEVHPRAGAFLRNLVQLGAGETSEDRLPHHILFERCYLHGDPQKGARRGIAMNSAHTAVLDSYLADFKEVGADSQAISGWNGPGPFKLVNNYLEGAGENVMFGGGDPSVPNLVPSDIEIRRNLFRKPLAWKVGEAGFGGTAWTVKNLFELKNARRVLVEGNLFEHNWVHAQNGFAILFTVRNQDGGAPWSVVEDVTFVNNVVRHAAAGVNILGRDDNHPSQQTKRIRIANNLFEDVGGARWGGGGALVQLLDGAADVVIEHNTAFQTGNIVTADGAAHRGFVYRDNIAPHNAFGLIGTGTGVGNPTLARYFPGGVVTKNVTIGGNAGSYPPGNFFPPSLADVGFVDHRRGDYRLAGSSRFRRAGADGRDIGLDVDELAAAMSESGRRPSQRHAETRPPWGRLSARTAKP
ncbi:MAG: hypothetical protein HYV62_14010 [Candidatus Rokubacteria bacterium]|nr:hypothetical protein [Candidatus Rokubacteria bacterium]